MAKDVIALGEVAACDVTMIEIRCGRVRPARALLREAAARDILCRLAGARELSRADPFLYCWFGADIHILDTRAH
jgi:hypothetical protein